MFSIKNRVFHLAALSTLALGTLAAAGMSGPQPRRAGKDLDIRAVLGNIGGNFGWSHDYSRGRDDRNDKRRAELAPSELTLTAYQAGDTVIVIASGANRTGGFSTQLERSGGFGASSIFLRNFAPLRGTAVTQRITPFEVTGSFTVRGRVDEIHITVAGISRCVKVCRVDSIGSGGFHGH